MDKAKAPNNFKLGCSWKVVAKALETYLGQIMGSGRAPLKYVIRKVKVPDPNTIYQTEQERNISIVSLIKEAFPHDNSKVYDIIKQLVLQGPGKSYILPYSGGRQAWLALRANYKGEGFKNRNVNGVYATLEHLFYEWEKKGFTFEKFLEKYNWCSLELERHDEPLKGIKKIRWFLSRIKAPELQAAV
jgi:hypothetical protein